MIVLTALVILGIVQVLGAQIYLDPAYSVEERIADLLPRMSLDEKLGQMTQAERNNATPSDITNYYLGSILSGGGSVPSSNTPTGWADMIDSLQAAALATPLQIPLIYGVDAVHGHNNVVGATMFPHNIGLGAAADPALMIEIGEVIAKEVAATGCHWTFAPCLAVPQNEKWGRTYEGFGEDPAIANLLTYNYVMGLQGSTMDGESIVACAKHWVGDGGTTNGQDQGDTVCTEQELRDTHIAPYYEAINANVGTFMATYSSWNGDKVHGIPYLLTDVLKTEMGFDGFIVSDWNAIGQVAQPFSNAVKQCINAGIDMAMEPSNWGNFINTLRTLVNGGDVPMSRIDDAVARILRVKFASGLFETPYTDRSITNGGTFGSAAHREVAREAVRKSLVLLKNADNVLPLSPSANIFVAGKNANNIGNQCGGWTITWQGSSGNITPGTTILQGIQNTATGNVTFSETGTGAAGNDVAVVVIGETPYAEGSGDDADLSLEATDTNCLNNVLAAGIPTVVILVSGRPMLVTNQIDSWDALIAAWLPGTEGQGVADVLFGNYDFTGTLPHSWPRDMTQVPINVGDATYDPLFAYGYGLEYGLVFTPTPVPTPTPIPTPTPTPGPSAPPGDGLTGDYFDNPDLTNLVVTRIDPNVDFDWGRGAPDPACSKDTWSTRWTGGISPLHSEVYTFYTLSDDGVRLWVNNQLIIDQWFNHGVLEFSGAISLTANQTVPITLEYYDNTGGASCKLFWSSASQPKVIVPQNQLHSTY